MTSSNDSLSDIAMSSLDEFTGYEKGVVARALLECLIKQGNLIDITENDQEFEIRLCVHRWHLELLACFSDEVQSARQEQQKLLEKLKKLT